MTDPPYSATEHAEGDGPATNDSRPLRRETSPFQDRSSVSTITPEPPTQAPDPIPTGGYPGSNGWIELLKWLLSDHRRAAWAFAVLGMLLLGAVTTAGLLAPHIGDLGGLLGGGMVGGGLGLGGGAAAERYCRRRRDRDEPDEE